MDTILLLSLQAICTNYVQQVCVMNKSFIQTWNKKKIVTKKNDQNSQEICINIYHQSSSETTYLKRKYIATSTNKQQKENKSRTVENELIEYSKHVSLLCSLFFFLTFLSDLMVKCINDCCHLEVAHTVESLQFFFQQLKNAHSLNLRNSNL